MFHTYSMNFSRNNSLIAGSLIVSQREGYDLLNSGSLKLKCLNYSYFKVKGYYTGFCLHFSKNFMTRKQASLL